MGSSHDDAVVERDSRRKKKAQTHDLLVERKQHNLKKAQRMKKPSAEAEGFLFSLFFFGRCIEIYEVRYVIL